MAIDVRTPSNGAGIGAWLKDGPTVKRWLMGGFGSFAISAALSLIFCFILLYAMSSLASAIFGGTPSGGSTTGVPTSGGPGASEIAGQGAKAIAVVWSFVFFQAHLVPYSISGLGSLSLSVFGVGSLTILASTLILCFMNGRAVEHHGVPTESSAMAALRGAGVAVPFWVGCLLLYFVGAANLGSGSFALQLHPFGVALVTPALLAAAAAALGAVTAHPRTQPSAYSIRNGVAWGIGAVLIGIVLMILLGIIAAGLSGNPVPSTTGSSGTSAPTLGSQQTAALGHLGASLLLLAVFYIFNAIALAWGFVASARVLGSSGVSPIIFAAPVLAVILGGLNIRRSDLAEKISFVATFAVLSTALAFAASPSTGTGTVGPEAWMVFLVTAGLSLIAAFAAPYLASVSAVQRVLGGPPLAWAAAPWLRLGTQPGAEAQTLGAAGELAPAEFHLSRGAVIGLGAVLIIVVAAVAGNAVISGNYSPDKAAVAYLNAQAKGDVDAMWSHGIYQQGSGLFQSSDSSYGALFTRDALAGMMTLSENRSISSPRVSSVETVNETTSKVTVSLTRNGGQTSQVLEMRKDASQKALGIYPVWKVVVPSQSLAVEAPKNSGALTVDGISVPAPSSFASVPVIAGYHKVGIAGSAILAADAATVDATNSRATAKFTPTAKPGVLDKAGSTVLAALQKCVGNLGPAPANCPNETFVSQATNTSWTMDSPPTVDGTSVGDEPDTVVVHGKWAMHFHYDESFGSFSFHSDPAESGPYVATLKWNGSGFDLASMARY